MEFNYAKLRSVRQEQGLTISDLAEKCGASASLISQIERGKVVPTLTIFLHVCQALNLPMHYFFEANPDEELVVRKDNRKVIKLPNSHVEYQLLSPNLHGQIEFLLVEIQPGPAVDTEAVFTHAGEECGFVLDGELIVHFSTSDVHLKAGDSICFPSTTPHRYHNPGATVSRSVWAMTPPSF
ncbi:cupin domain-containing protein [Alicyclobacillaceae bacterium I2511]|nr:cupin domain-containing protein [Alicyclobacillaceae bacterium I2511]